jgi:hypothetical protein
MTAKPPSLLILFGWFASTLIGSVAITYVVYHATSNRVIEALAAICISLAPLNLIAKKLNERNADPSDEDRISIRGNFYTQLALAIVFMVNVGFWLRPNAALNGLDVVHNVFIAMYLVMIPAVLINAVYLRKRLLGVR